jgi:hypothetical protein
VEGKKERKFRGKQTKMRHKRNGQKQNSVEGKKERKFRGKVQGRNVNYEERKERSDGLKETRRPIEISKTVTCIREGLILHLTRHMDTHDRIISGFTQTLQTSFTI